MVVEHVCTDTFTEQLLLGSGHPVPIKERSPTSEWWHQSIAAAMTQLSKHRFCLHHFICLGVLVLISIHGVENATTSGKCCEDGRDESPTPLQKNAEA